MYRLTLLLVLATLTGCSGDPHQRGKLHGTVSYKGKPLTSGMVIFLGADQQSYIADLDEKGSYTIDRIPYGTVKVAIQQAPARPAPRANPSPSQGKGGVSESKDAARQPPPAPEPKMSGVVVPANYNQAETSGLSFEMKEPNQEWNTELK